jgi:hypothetical protein
VLDVYKPPAKVNSALINKIHEMRMALPAWHGVHALTPGVSSGQ